jgi:hypothetical protein
MTDIIREEPIKKIKKNYPNRYNKNVFEKYNEIISNNNLLNQYELLEKGINYNTNRKIKINGKIYNELIDKFKIKYEHNDGNGCIFYNNILFKNLENINADLYLCETKQINNEIDNYNKNIDIYNKKIDEIKIKINLLNNWNEYILFEKIKYGINKNIINDIHVKNNCNGNMIFKKTDTEFIFNDRPFCNYEDKEITYKYFKCDKCNYEYKKEIIKKGGGTQYIPKSGFWWK